MKSLYLSLFLALYVMLSCNAVIAQCDNVSVDDLINPGPFQVATLTEADGLRNGPEYNGATVYYPTDGIPPYVSIAIVPGFTALPSSVQEWGPFYASHGIVTIIIGTNSLVDFPEERAIALLDALETIRQENEREDSPLVGDLNLDRLAVSGWSMGGGGAQRAAVLDNTIAGVIALCPFLSNPQLEHSSPILILSGENDPTAPPAQHADVHYNATPITTDKLLFEIANGNHSVANTPNGGDGATGQLALSWLKLYVEGNECYCSILEDDLLDNPTAASKVEQDFLCSSLGLNRLQKVSEAYPNPAKDMINIPGNGKVQYQFISALGQVMLNGELTGNDKQIDISEYPEGLYYLIINGKTFKILKENR
ncbi:T9SS C-terminal target domain-containing protein [Dokdonia sinensis]|uniref:T9SS C-terminal target domain-containing protein n=1 Tax=Dokdonia sinensis TaxID=2479847 RepID=A0A3M0G815_9FLAO|nr:T9SS type A sorting domain-containing protein [Dokdonia sinensis]RMB61105.1 T9SS C-terminal target domain-containing protein [Dokdonia sinensis]